MNERTVRAELAAITRQQVRRRAKRGVVAGYIHQLSARHRASGERSAGRPDAALATAPRS